MKYIPNPQPHHAHGSYGKWTSITCVLAASLTHRSLRSRAPAVYHTPTTEVTDGENDRARQTSYLPYPHIPSFTRSGQRCSTHYTLRLTLATTGPRRLGEAVDGTEDAISTAAVKDVV
eukprot:42582-Eustigmatos_ZCMA.PRE.1